MLSSMSRSKPWSQPEELEILSYRLYCELSFKEIASLTGMTTTACAKKYYAILSHIKKKIKL
jgi:hypothetical protein